MFEEQTFLREIAEVALDTAYAKDMDGRYVWVNRASASRMGFEPADVLGKTAADLFGDEYAHVTAIDRLVIERGEAITGEERASVDGQERVYLVTRWPLRGSSGEITGLVGAARDVTEERQAREELRRVARHLEQAEGLAQVGSWEWWVAEDMSWFSPEMYRLLGLDPAIPIDYASGFELLYPGDRERIAGLVDEAFETGEPVHFHSRAVDPEGGVRHFENRIEAVTDDHGGRVRLFGVAQDVTELTATRADLQSRGEQLDIAQRLAGLGSWESDVHSDVQTWSDEFFRILGYDPGEVPASVETYLGAVHPDDREVVRNTVGRALRGRASFELQHRIVRPDGEERVVDCRGSTVRIGHTRMVGICQDVTDQRRREDHLRHRADHDDLTGLLDRNRFEHELTRQLAVNARYGGSCATLVIDVDGFKQVNDTHGHGAGDRVLSELAAALTQRLRETDLKSRLGGDEFAVLLPSANRDQAAQLAGSLLDAIRATGVTVSIGVAVAEGAGQDAGEILGRADMSMYDAKKAGRDRVALA